MRPEQFVFDDRMGRFDRDELAVKVPFRSTCYLDSVVVSGGEILTSVLFQPKMADAICGGTDSKVSAPVSVVLPPHSCDSANIAGVVSLEMSFSTTRD